MKKSLLPLILSLFLFGQSFGQWQKAKLPASNAILSLAVDYSTSYVYAGSAGNGVYLSADTGDNWSTANTGLPANLNVWNILIRNKNIFLATNDGVYSSANNGTSWQQAGLNGVLVNSFTSYSSGDTTFLYAGTEKGIYLSKNNGKSWSIFAFSGFGVSAMLSFGENSFYAGMTNGGLNYYEDYRKTWTVADTGITNKTIVKSVKYIHYVQGNILFPTSMAAVTDRGVYLMKSKGNWIKSTVGLASDTMVNSITTSGYDGSVYSIYDGLVLIGTGADTGNVYSYHDFLDGGSWSAISTGIDGRVNALVIYQNIMFAGGSSLWVLKSNQKYLYLTGNPAEMPAEGDTTAFNIHTNDSWFFINTTSDFLTISPETGTGDANITFVVKPNNTNSLRVGMAMINGHGENLVSFIQFPVNATGIDNTSSTNITIFPVPVKDDLVISFPNQSGNIRFAIYNLSGMELLALQLTGNTTKVDLSGFIPGIYILRLYLKNNCITRKIIKQ
ncbi:MAG: T9SS type A sorting domain-containing protein [Bacteroidota bacterium]